ncbi:hypothetical protein PIB30_028778 [Stylosanthes scabra]|uniref:PB1-like domain-containing protein n=1 Tax=Stylosanthes scabra TaxID=79078 RepID=A0ABU6Z9T6_9FABA|nr:hypothetical protein [Stylosanthes scabra]
MGDLFVVPVFHHGGKFIRNLLGELEYVDELVERFPEMDVDHVNFGDMEKLYEDLGYREYRDWDHVANDAIVEGYDEGVNGGNNGGLNGGNDDANLGANGDGDAPVP